MGAGERRSGMRRVIGDRERAQRATARLRVLQHYEQVSRSISRTCRFFGISRTLFYEWRRRYQRDGLEGLRPRLPGPRVSPFRTPPHIEALVLRVRQDRQYGVPRLRFFLRRYHAVSLSMPTIRRILREHHEGIVRLLAALVSRFLASSGVSHRSRPCPSFSSLILGADENTSHSSHARRRRWHWSARDRLMGAADSASSSRLTASRLVLCWLIRLAVISARGVFSPNSVFK